MADRWRAICIITRQRTVKNVHDRGVLTVELLTAEFATVSMEWLRHKKEGCT
jgi:hypothetical protein